LLGNYLKYESSFTSVSNAGLVTLGNVETGAIGAGAVTGLVTVTGVRTGIGSVISGAGSKYVRGAVVVGSGVRVVVSRLGSDITGSVYGALATIGSLYVET